MVTFIAVLVIEVAAYFVYRSYRNAATRVEGRRSRVVNTAHATEYTGPTYGRRER